MPDEAVQQLVFIPYHHPNGSPMLAVAGNVKMERWDLLYYPQQGTSVSSAIGLVLLSLWSGSRPSLKPRIPYLAYVLDYSVTLLNIGRYPTLTSAPVDLEAIFAGSRPSEISSAIMQTELLLFWFSSS